ncbi:phage major capsid protein [Listeria innocua]|uniref:Phage major capsid protein n=1 Tax=Listeria innocua TaxID=1642 RepID=A0AB73HAA4_LISIO|nr:phage major capsid protein [Listeria innocua]MBC2142851.1 phage major capsid protein [Listeria innocua]
MKTLFEVKQDLMNVGNQLKKANDTLLQTASTPGISQEQIKESQNAKDTLQLQFEILQKQHDEMDKEQKQKLSSQSGTKAQDPNQQLINAKAELIKKTMKKEAVNQETMNVISQSNKGNILQALLDNTATGGNNFIPKNTGTSVISEPVQKNPLRDLSAFTNIANLELPKVSFTLADDDFIADGATAKELAATGSVVAFGRNKFKVFTDISETVLNGTNTDLVSTVEKNLRAGVAAKEKKVAFATTPKTGEEHMSFYSSAVGITEIEGDTMYESILNALADLEDEYDEVASVVMRKQDYFKMIKELANGADTLFGRKPEDVIGYPVEFCSLAVDPVVGDFSFSHFNYDPDALYEQDKNIKTGMNSFVVTAWFDHQIKLSSAFRIATVAP